jgi:UDP-N-acetylglucosamine 2-epimerase (non-hydrolysing)
MPGLRLTEPLGYLDFLHLMAHARLVLTDSGGVQEETTALGVPCLTLRDTTERPVTVSQGTNRVVGTRPEGIVRAARRVLTGPRPRRRVPPLWDGHAGERVARVLARVVAGRG